MARKNIRKAMQDRIDAAMASAAVWFMDAWTVVERGWRRPLSKLALRLKFAFYPLLAVAALAWLGWDWSHARNLAAAEDANPAAVKYLNRLSDWLFVAGRVANENGARDVLWVPGASR